MNTLIAYLNNAIWATWLVMGILSLYLIVVMWIFAYRSIALSSWQSREQEAADAIIRGHDLDATDSLLRKCLKGSKEHRGAGLEACVRIATREATVGLTALSIIASTAPFVGLFGTVVSILHSFSQMGVAGGASMQVLAPAISEALIATAIGIFVAIPAYAAHLALKRQAFAVLTFLNIQTDFLRAKLQEAA